MDESPDLIGWARSTAERLTNAWDAGLFAVALDFLRTNAGAESDVYRKACAIPNSIQVDVQGKFMARYLINWADYVEAGFATSEPMALRTRSAAATDLMEQVQTLLDDRDVHPAAPVMLAGAAVEEYLRGLVEANSISITGKPGLNSYASALRAADLITPQDLKDVTSIAGARNDAAHGDFDKVSDERARVTAALVNLFLRQKTGA